MKDPIIFGDFIMSNPNDPEAEANYDCDIG
jgi:hypothetical protein